MVIKHIINNSKEVTIEIPDNELEFINGYAVVEFKEPTKFESIVRGIVSREKEVIVEPSRYVKGITILPDKTALITVVTRPIVQFIGDGESHQELCDSTKVKHIDLVKTDINNIVEISEFGKGFEILPNGNIKVRKYKGKKDGENVILFGDIIYNPILREFVSPLMTEIGPFTTDEETGIFYAHARITASEGDTTFSLYCKMNGEGFIISPLYNAATKGTISVSRENFTLSGEIERTRQYIKSKKEIENVRITRLPFISPVKVTR